MYVPSHVICVRQIPKVSLIVNYGEIGSEFSTHGVDTKFIYGVGWKARRKGPLGRFRRRWEDNKLDLRETMGLYGLDRSGSG
jgi:hypothetical protein